VTRYGDLWPEVVSWPNLILAARKARRGKRDRDAVQRFEFHQERELLRLQRELDSGEYRPGAFTTHWITRPKPRLISAAPYRDRVVHHALMNVLEPILDRHFHRDSYACRIGKGTHHAARRLQQLMGQFPYTLQCDVVKFFPSIDHDILKELFRQRIKDRRLLALLDAVVDGSNEQEPVTQWFPGDDLFTPAERRKGLPIGNLTSQWFANWYLTDFDHLVTSRWGIGGYVRYCDDFVLLDRDRDRLRGFVPCVIEGLAEVRLAIHRHRSRVSPSRVGRMFVGFRIKTHLIRIRNANVRLFLTRLGRLRQEFTQRRLSREEVHQRLAGWLGHAIQADSLPLLARLARGWEFCHGRFWRFTRRPSDGDEAIRGRCRQHSAGAVSPSGAVKCPAPTTGGHRCRSTIGPTAPGGRGCTSSG
jgi:retron-type reverse transcriptase